MMTSDADICTLIAKSLDQSNRSAVTPASDLRKELELDSLGLLTVAFILEEELGIELMSSPDCWTEARSIADIIAIVRRAEQR